MFKEITHIDVGGQRIRELRGGAGRPLLYLHSAGAENEMWVPFLDGLAEKYELHSPSHPGFLGSEGLDQIKVIGDLADFYLDYIRAQGWQSVNVVGLSFGGWIAAELAARHPASVNHLVLLGIDASNTPSP